MSKKNYSIKLFDTTEEYENYISLPAGIWVKIDFEGHKEEAKVEYIESENKVYNGELYYAYAANGFTIYSKTLYTEGGYENQTLYEWQGNEMIPDEGLLYTVTVNDEGYVEPHVSVCKDTMKVNYNKIFDTVFVCQDSGFQTCGRLIVMNSDGKVLITLTGQDGYIKMPSDHKLYITEGSGGLYGYYDYTVIEEWKGYEKVLLYENLPSGGEIPYGGYY